MAGLATIATSLLLLTLWADYLIPADFSVIPSFCCMSFISKQIPENRVVSYQLSNGSVCPRAGVIFTTKKGQKFCSNPKQLWVQRYMKNLDAKQKFSTRPRALKIPFWRRLANSSTL